MQLCWCFALALAVRSSAAAPTLISDLPDIGEDEGEDEFGDLGPDPNSDLMMYEDGGMLWEEDGMMGYYGDPQDVEEQLQKLFDRFDANQDKRLDVTELRAALKAQADHYQTAAADSAFSESEQILQQADADGDGKLTEQEFEEMETLYLQHEHAIGRSALFHFADGGEPPAGGGDGVVEAHELQVLIFPESHPRGSELGRLMAQRVIREHDADGDAKMDKAELFAFHKKGRHEPGGTAGHGPGGWPPFDGAEDDEDEDGDEGEGEERRGGDEQQGDVAGWREHHGRHRPLKLHREDRGLHNELEYASHNETFDWHDKDGDGHLDAAELLEYVLPRREYQGYVEEELQQLLSLLRNDDRGEEGEREKPADEADAAFDLDRLKEIGANVLSAFPMLSPDDDGMDPREL